MIERVEFGNNIKNYEYKLHQKNSFRKNAKFNYLCSFMLHSLQTIFSQLFFL